MKTGKRKPDTGERFNAARHGALLAWADAVIGTVDRQVIGQARENFTAIDEGREPVLIVQQAPEERPCPNDVDGDGLCGHMNCPFCRDKRPKTETLVPKDEEEAALLAIAGRVRAARVQAAPHLSPPGFARLHGISSVTLWQVENARVRSRYGTYQKLAAALGVKCVWLMTGKAVAQ